MSPEFAYVMEELMVEHRRADKKRYVEQILETIIIQEGSDSLLQRWPI